MVTTLGESDERALVEAAKADRARFLDLYDRFFHRVYVYALRRTGNRADAEDVTSEVFHRALAKLDGYQWRGVPFVAWLYRIAANEIADRHHVSSRYVGDTTEQELIGDPEFDRTVALFDLIDRLPSDQRRVIELRFGEGRSLREAAGALGRSEGAIKQLQRRAIEALRAMLENTNG